MTIEEITAELNKNYNSFVLSVDDDERTGVAVNGVGSELIAHHLLIAKNLATEMGLSLKQFFSLEKVMAEQDDFTPQKKITVDLQGFLKQLKELKDDE